MVCKSTLVANVVLAVILAASPVSARLRWLERDGRPIYVHSRSFGHENPAVIGKLNGACAGQVCGPLSGNAISTLLAASPECAQQDMADQIIDAAAQFDAATQKLMISLAIEFRQAEKNTPPDFTTNPPTQRNSVFCQKAPKNSQLNGLVQAQDPANDPNVFFDPATKKSVTKGSQANTLPFGGKASSSGGGSKAASSAAAPANSGKPCPAPVTVTVTAAATASAKATTTPCPKPKTFTVTASSAAAAATTPAAGAGASSANLQKFTGALGGVTPPTVTSLGGGKFQVTGNAQFNSEQNALVRSCDVQHNQCANKANATGNKGDLTVTACGTQQDSCNALARSTASS